MYLSWKNLKKCKYNSLCGLVSYQKYTVIYSQVILRIRHADHVAPSISKSWRWLRRQAAVTRSLWFALGLRACSFSFSLVRFVKNGNFCKRRNLISMKNLCQNSSVVFQHLVKVFLILASYQK
jgi:hypothetical protein